MESKPKPIPNSTPLYWFSCETPLKLICTFIIFLTFTRFVIIVNDIYHNGVYDELWDAAWWGGFSKLYYNSRASSVQQLWISGCLHHRFFCCQITEQCSDSILNARRVVYTYLSLPWSFRGRKRFKVWAAPARWVVQFIIKTWQTKDGGCSR